MSLPTVSLRDVVGLPTVSLRDVVVLQTVSLRDVVGPPVSTGDPPRRARYDIGCQRKLYMSEGFCAAMFGGRGCLMSPPCLKSQVLFRLLVFCRLQELLFVSYLFFFCLLAHSLAFFPENSSIFFVKK